MIKETGNKLILGDGTVLDNATAGYSQGWLWCYVPDITIETAALIFFDRRKTISITYQYGIMSDRYDGYTRCTNLSIDVDGLVHVCLVKE